MVVQYEVILATFNGARYLKEQLDSIAWQTRPPTRIIISDDGSVDDTLFLAKEWAEQSSVCVTFLPTSGTALMLSSWRLLASTSSNLVMLSDQDDVWDIDKAEKLLNHGRFREHFC